MTEIPFNMQFSFSGAINNSIFFPFFLDSCSKEGHGTITFRSRMPL